jgi:hypothetical protein
VRIPVSDWLQVRLRADWRIWLPTPIDMSASGILVDFTPDLPPVLAKGDEVRLHLEYEQLAFGLAAAVRRHDACRFGLAFILFEDRSRLGPEPIRALVSSLERRWLARRSGRWSQ